LTDTLWPDSTDELSDGSLHGDGSARHGRRRKEEDGESVEGAEIRYPPGDCHSEIETESRCDEWSEDSFGKEEKDSQDDDGDVRELSWDMDEDRYCRYPAILRTSRQIHAEAIIVLYSELEVVLRLDDLLSTEQPLSHSLTMGGIVFPTTRAWRHHPIHGIGNEDKNGKRIHASPKARGYIEPHMFPKFNRIGRYAEFDLSILSPLCLLTRK